MEIKEHSSCPLCRERLDPEDPRIFTYSSSMRFLLRNYSRSIMKDEAGVETELQLYIQREVEESRWSSRFGIGSSLRRLLVGGKNADESISVGNRASDSRYLHRFNHRILVPRVIFNNRWSDLRSSDLMFLNSEMINSKLSDKLFESRSDARWPGKSVQPTAEDHPIKVREEMELKRSIEMKFVINNKTGSGSNSDAGIGLVLDEKRSMSEITALSLVINHDDIKMKKKIKLLSM